MAIIMGCYYGFYLPQIIFEYIDVPDQYGFYISRGLIDILFFGNSLVNPFIYAWHQKDFNKAFKTLLYVKQSQRRTGSNLSKNSLSGQQNHVL